MVQRSILQVRFTEKYGYWFAPHPPPPTPHSCLLHLARRHIAVMQVWGGNHKVVMSKYQD